LNDSTYPQGSTVYIQEVIKKAHFKKTFQAEAKQGFNLFLILNAISIIKLEF